MEGGSDIPDVRPLAFSMKPMLSTPAFGSGTFLTDRSWGDKPCT